MFTIRGMAGGRMAQMTWHDDGTITGDHFLVDLIKYKAMRMEGEPVGFPEGPFTETNHLSSPLSVLFLASQYYDFIVDSEGVVPKRLRGK
ncbi:hypothetical protein [Ammoniphilus sp. CFH 90114]|uniref:hypothetical protein n=1 Tax=Ammoniphilus sp. CFH 90114 TaxID=2493665 RepID=UPI00100E577B|nr:hypothetical protein [Ammoniphilus sp. CFH 90114]RXT15324.1 hypothetical protein EIZ39_03725 [Ammoniphilus sp. CFH 90114]